MAGLWRTLTLSLVFSLFHSFAASQSFENAAVVRTAELGGALVHFMTTYAVKALEQNAKTYTLAFTQGELKKTSWLEVKLKETGQVLDVTNNGLDASCNCYLFDVALPKPPAVGSTITILVETIQTHATEPWPETAAQSDPQSLRFQTELFVISPYTTQVFRSKFRTSSPNYLSYTKPEGLQKFTSDAPVTKSGSTITYGPYNGLPITANLGFIGAYQQQLNLHYTYDYPVFEIRKLTRAAEISHWGANLNIQDEIHLHNGGPKLKGHFSRIDYATQSFRGQSPAHVIPGFALHLPPGAKNVYYYDQIGNVSTSNFRPASGNTKHSVLALKPRYPIMGGWNYTFTLGWDAPLSDTVTYDKKSGKYIAEIPIMTDIPTSVVNDAELKIVLPEGATDVHFQAPFPARTTEVVKHITYLDTVGRPALIFQYNDLTSRHVQSIYVSYRVPLSAHLKKPLAVATFFLSLFGFAFAVRRVDFSIQRKKKL